MNIALVICCKYCMILFVILIILAFIFFKLNFVKYHFFMNAMSETFYKNSKLLIADLYIIQITPEIRISRVNVKLDHSCKIGSDCQSILKIHGHVAQVRKVPNYSYKYQYMPVIHNSRNKI